MIMRLFRKYQYIKNILIIQSAASSLFGVYLTEQKVVDGMKRLPAVARAHMVTAEDALQRLQKMALAVQKANRVNL